MPWHTPTLEEEKYNLEVARRDEHIDKLREELSNVPIGFMTLNELYLIGNYFKCMNTPETLDRLMEIRAKIRLNKINIAKG